MPDLETEEATLNNLKRWLEIKKMKLTKSLKINKNRLNKLNNDVKKIKDYIKENNNKIIDMKNKLNYTENKCNNLLLNRNQLYNE